MSTVGVTKWVVLPGNTFLPRSFTHRWPLSNSSAAAFFRPKRLWAYEATCEAFSGSKACKQLRVTGKRLIFDWFLFIFEKYHGKVMKSAMLKIPDVSVKFLSFCHFRWDASVQVAFVQAPWCFSKLRWRIFWGILEHLKCTEPLPRSPEMPRSQSCDWIKCSCGMFVRLVNLASKESCRIDNICLYFFAIFAIYSYIS